jgi:hypothetical protein
MDQRQVMAKRIALVSFLVAVILGAGSGLRAETVAEIVANPEAFDKKQVTVVGELIGDYGERRSGAQWAQLNEDSYAFDPVALGGPLTGPNTGFGIRIREGSVPDLGHPGGFQWRGPLVEVTGIWIYHDPDRGGESYLDVTAIDVIDDSEALPVDHAPVPALLGGVLLASAAAVLVITRRRS